MWARKSNVCCESFQNLQQTVQLICRELLKYLRHMSQRFAVSFYIPTTNHPFQYQTGALCHTSLRHVSARFRGLFARKPAIQNIYCQRDTKHCTAGPEQNYIARSKEISKIRTLQNHYAHILIYKHCTEKYNTFSITNTLTGCNNSGRKEAKKAWWPAMVTSWPPRAPLLPFTQREGGGGRGNLLNAPCTTPSSHHVEKARLEPPSPARQRRKVKHPQIVQ